MKSSKSVIGLMALIGIFILGTATIGGAQAMPKEGGPWQSYIGTYFWVPGVNGVVKVKDLRADLDWEIGESLDNAKFFAAVRYEGFGKNWGIMFDTMTGVMEFDKSIVENSLPGTQQFTESFSRTEIAVPYRVSWMVGGAFDMFIGARYNRIGAQLVNEIGNARSFEKKYKDWLDAFIGARVLLPLSREWFLGFRADIGGFGIGLESSDVALNGDLSINWQITPLVSLSAGYRASYLKYTNDNINYDATTHGPWIGVGFSF
jgi:hypothetical protein